MVIGLMSADPKPVIFAIPLARDGSVTPTDFYGVNATFFLKTQGGMLRVRLEERKIFMGKLLRLLWKLFIGLPERRQRVRLHGNGVKLPASISASSSCNLAVCIPPGEKSSSIC